MIGGRSRSPTDCAAYQPTPFRSKTVSVRIAPPPSTAAKSSPKRLLIPIVSLFGLDFAAVLGGGAILTETVFDLKGVGCYAAQSVCGLELPADMGRSLFLA